MSTNVLLNDFLMNSSSSSLVQEANVFDRQIYQSTIAIEERDRLKFILGIVICCVSISSFFLPEKPHEFASICEKYNTSNACQIW